MTRRIAPDELCRLLACRRSSPNGSLHLADTSQRRDCAHGRRDGREVRAVRNDPMAQAVVTNEGATDGRREPGYVERPLVSAWSMVGHGMTTRDAANVVAAPDGLAAPAPSSGVSTAPALKANDPVVSGGLAAGRSVSAGRSRMPRFAHGSVATLPNSKTRNTTSPGSHGRHRAGRCGGRTGSAAGLRPLGPGVPGRPDQPALVGRHSRDSWSLAGPCRTRCQEGEDA